MIRVTGLNRKKVLQFSVMQSDICVNPAKSVLLDNKSAIQLKATILIGVSSVPQYINRRKER